MQKACESNKAACLRGRAEEFLQYVYAGSPVSKGKLQFDMRYVEPKSRRWDWAGLKEKIAKHGLRNSLLVALVPTPSTAQVLGTFAPYAHNLYVCRVLADVFVQLNRRLLRDLIGRNLRIELNQLYAEVWKLKQHILLEFPADRDKPQLFYNIART